MRTNQQSRQMLLLRANKVIKAFAVKMTQTCECIDHNCFSQKDRALSETL